MTTAEATTPCNWYYKGEDGRVHGPHSSTRMLEWFRAGYFGLQLLLRRDCDAEDEYVPLTELIQHNHGQVPFLAVPLRPNASYPQAAVPTSWPAGMYVPMVSTGQANGYYAASPQAAAAMINATAAAGATTGRVPPPSCQLMVAPGGQLVAVPHSLMSPPAQAPPSGMATPELRSTPSVSPPAAYATTGGSSDATNNRHILGTSDGSDRCGSDDSVSVSTPIRQQRHHHHRTRNINDESPFLNGTLCTSKSSASTLAATQIRTYNNNNTPQQQSTLANGYAPGFSVSDMS